MTSFDTPPGVDSKTAILVFNRGVETSTVLSGIDGVAKGHGNFKRTANWPHESGLRYVFHSNGDKNRELTLTVCWCFMFRSRKDDRDCVAGKLLFCPTT